MTKRPIKFDAAAFASKRVEFRVNVTVDAARAKLAKPSMFARVAAWLDADV